MNNCFLSHAKPMLSCFLYCSRNFYFEARTTVQHKTFNNYNFPIFKHCQISQIVLCIFIVIKIEVLMLRSVTSFVSFRLYNQKTLVELLNYSVVLICSCTHCSSELAIVTWFAFQCCFWKHLKSDSFQTEDFDCPYQMLSGRCLL